jgi:hypothetical protein
LSRNPAWRGVPLRATVENQPARGSKILTSNATILLECSAILRATVEILPEGGDNPDFGAIILAPVEPKAPTVMNGSKGRLSDAFVAVSVQMLAHRLEPL